MNNLENVPPIYPKQDEKIEENKQQSENKETEIGKKILFGTKTPEKESSSWWDWSIEYGKSFILSIAGVKEALQEGTNVALNAITYSFNPTSFINDSYKKMTTLTKDPQLPHVIGPIAKKISAFLWPTHEETIKDLLKQYVPESVYNGVLTFIDVNSQYIGRMIEANMISILGNLAIKYAPAPIDPKLTEAINDEIKTMMNQMGPFSESVNESIIRERLGKIKDKFIEHVCPEGIENLKESDPMRLSLKEIEKTLQKVPSSLSEKIKQAANDKENRSQLLANITREIFLDPLPSRAPYSALPDVINHFVKTINDKIVKASEQREKADIKAIIKEFTDEVIDAALPNGIDSLLIPDVGGVVHKAINFWFPMSSLKAMVADLAQQAYDKAAEKRDMGTFIESLELPKETTDLIMPVIKNSLDQELSGSFLDVGKYFFNGLTNPAIEEMKNRKILGKELSDQCDKWSEEIMGKVKDPLISTLTSAIFGESIKDEDKEFRLQLENQFKVLFLQDHDASTLQDGSLAWGASGHVRALLIHVMAKIKQKSGNSPLLFNADILAKAVKEAFKPTENEIENKIEMLELDLELAKNVRADFLKSGLIESLTEQERLALNPSKGLPEIDNKIQMQTKKRNDLQQQLSKIDLMEIENDIDIQTKELKELEWDLADIDKPNPSADRLVAINAMKREIRELEVNLELSKTTKQNAQTLKESLTNEIEDLEIELFELGIERNVVLEGTEALQKRFEGIAESLLGSIGMGKDEKMAIPFIRDMLKNEILPSLLLDQTKDMIALQVERVEIEEDIKSHKRGAGAVSLAKPIAKFVLDVVKGAIVEPKELANELCACYKEIATSEEQMSKLEKSIEKLIKDHPGHIKKKALANLIAKIDVSLKPDLERLQMLKEKINKGLISSNTLGDAIGDVLTDEKLIGMKLTGLSTEQKRSIGQQIKELLSSKMPEDIDKFLGDHIELMVLKILSNLGKNIAKDGEDILVAAGLKFKELSAKYIQEGKEPDVDKITEEIFALADITDKSLPGIPKALQSLLYGLAKAEVGRRIKDLYAKRALSKEPARLQDIKRSVEQKTHRPGKKQEEQIKLDVFCQQISEIGTQITFDLLLKDRKEEGNVIKLLQENILPTEGATELGESLLEVWDTFNKEEKTELEEGAKSHLKGLINTFLLEGFGNLFNRVLTETRSFNIAKITDLLKVVTDLLSEKPAVTKIGPKTREQAEEEKQAETTFFTRLTAQLIKFALPEGSKSKALEAIPEEYRQIAWTQLKTNILPLVLKGLCDSFLSEKGLKGIWVSILQSVNKRLALEKFDLNKAQIQTQEKKKLRQEEYQKLKAMPGGIAKPIIAPTGDKKLEPFIELPADEKALDAQAGETFMAITDKFAPGLMDNFLVRIIAPKEKIPRLVGSALRGMVTETFWMDMIETVIPKTIQKGKDISKTTVKSIEDLDTELKGELGKTMILGWQAFQSILDKAIYQATGTLGYEVKQVVDTSARMVILTMVGIVVKGIFGLQTNDIKERFITKGMEVIDFSVNLFNTDEKRRSIITKITNVFIPFEGVDKP